jgi:hypothetical protein
MRRGQDDPMRGDEATARSLRPAATRTGRGLRFRALPLSSVLCTVVVGLMVVTQIRPTTHHTLQRWFATSWERLRAGELWRVFTSTFVQGGPGLVAGVLVLLVLVPIAEARTGSAVTALAFFLGDWVSSIVALIGVRVGAALGSGTAAHVLVHLDSGTSAACYSCAGALLASMHPGRWRRALCAALLADLTIEGAVTHMLAEIQHPLAVLVGIAVARFATGDHIGSTGRPCARDSLAL